MDAEKERKFASSVVLNRFCSVSFLETIYIVLHCRPSPPRHLGESTTEPWLFVSVYNESGPAIIGTACQGKTGNFTVLVGPVESEFEYKTFGMLCKVKMRQAPLRRIMMERNEVIPPLERSEMLSMRRMLHVK